MKIGIITIQRSPNYGACLQAFSLYTFLKEKGYECEMIDLLRPTHPEYIASKKYKRYRTKTGFKSRLRNLYRWLFKHTAKQNPLTEEAKRNFDQFNDKIKYSKRYYSIDELYSNPPEYDIYITGSDQLWNPTIGFCIEPYFLTFVNNGGRKISYATSVGISRLEDNEKADFSRWLLDYYSISVREKSGCEIISELVLQKVTQVADPSFLLEPAVWQGLMVSPKIEEPYILLFTLTYSPVLLEFCRRLKHGGKKKLVYLCQNQSSADVTDVDLAIDNAGPSEFLGYIHSANMVITDSFHGTVFSLILEADNVFAYVPSSKKRGKRITDLLNTYHLDDHVLRDGLLVNYDELQCRPIDRESVNEMINIERKRSQEYLLEQLN